MSRTSYRHLAAVYDQLMHDAPYSKWLSWAEAMWRKEGIQPQSVIDLACGTGTLSWMLAETGRHVIGMDLSEEMLAVAVSKRDRYMEQGIGHNVQWLQQDMRQLQVPRQVDAIVCFCDGLNYLLKEADWQQTFRAVHQALRPGGLFLFDIHSEFKIRNLFRNNMFAWEESGVYCVWQNALDEGTNSVEEQLTLFVKQADGRYVRYDECHTQRTFSVKEVGHWLREAGFTVLSVTSEFQTSGEIKETDERLFFCVRKER